MAGPAGTHDSIGAISALTQWTGGRRKLFSSGTGSWNSEKAIVNTASNLSDENLISFLFFLKNVFHNGAY